MACCTHTVPDVLWGVTGVAPRGVCPVGGGSAARFQAPPRSSAEGQTRRLMGRTHGLSQEVRGQAPGAGTGEATPGSHRMGRLSSPAHRHLGKDRQRSADRHADPHCGAGLPDEASHGPPPPYQEATCERVGGHSHPVDHSRHDPGSRPTAGAHGRRNQWLRHRPLSSSAPSIGLHVWGQRLQFRAGGVTV